MIRVYLDTNVFSYLKNSSNPAIQNFHSSLKKYKSTLLYCYSHGHLLDFKQDKSDKKFDDLDFIETLADNNYISYNGMEKYTSCYLAKPREAFIGLGEDTKIDLKSIFDIDLKYLTPEQQEKFTNAKNVLLNQEFDFAFANPNGIPDDAKNALSKFLPVDKSKFTLLELSEHFMQILNVMNEDKTAYKDLRNYIDKNLNNGKFVVDDNNIDFNDDLKNSLLKKSFIEFVNNTLNPEGKKQITDYDFHIQAYTSLDILGISKDPSKKARFRNIFNDGMHSYYGAFCDYVVSSDEDFIKKTKALYKLLGLKTEVVSLNEFVQSIDIIANIEEKDIITFLQVLKVDISKGIILSSKPSLRYNRYTITIKPFHLYLSYFNKMEHIHEPDADYIVFSNQRHNYSNFVFYKEYQAVTNKAAKLFGDDLNFKGEFNFEIEKKEINEGIWKGRHWRIEDIEIVLEINKASEKFNLVLVIPKEIQKSKN
jgi:hypothetical protein